MFKGNPDVVTRKLLSTSSLTVAGDRIVDVICSTGDPDRMGDILVQKGINLKPYGANPIVLWNHSADVPVARSIEIGVRNEKLQAKVKFPPEGEDEDSDWVYGKIKAGIVNATSVGFIDPVVGQFECGRGLENWPVGAHIQCMAKPDVPRLLEVKVTSIRPDYWEWQVCDSEKPLVVGYATSRETAQIDGDSALFLTLGKS
jgi:hypothetical protein